MLAPHDFFDLSRFAHADLFAGAVFVWEALKQLPEYVARAFDLSPEDLSADRAGARSLVRISPGALVEDGAIVLGPALIGAKCRVYAGSLVRGPVILGEEVVVGHGCEVTSSAVLDGGHVSHLNFVGHTILGANVNLGAGAVCSNLKLGADVVKLRVGEEEHDTGMVKLGAVVGDDVQVGCNSVLNPGTLIGPRSWVYPAAQLRGWYPADHIIKVETRVQVIPRT